MSHPTRNWILVTGQPGCGKTTAVKCLSQALQDAGFQVQGFITEEVLDDGTGSRKGFDIVAVPDNKRGCLSRKRGLPSHWPRTGPYKVDVDSIDRVAVPSLSIIPNKQKDSTPDDLTASSQKSSHDIISSDPQPYPTIFVLDEIGRMELHSTKFQETVQKLLDYYDDNQYIRLVGAVTAPRYGHRGKRCRFQRETEFAHSGGSRQSHILFVVLHFLQFHFVTMSRIRKASRSIILQRKQGTKSHRIYCRTFNTSGSENSHAITK